MILTDIHCHILPGVDDGAPDMTVTKDMLDKMYDEGVRRIIATPHYRVGMFEPSIRSIQSSYLEVKNYARTIGKYGMMVKLGCRHIAGRQWQEASMFWLNFLRWIVI